jgi:NTP pyrophosphatase (non-canonical NTP hydrolase)
MTFRENAELVLRNLMTQPNYEAVDPQEWCYVAAQRLEEMFYKGDYLPFVSEVEEFNSKMGKDWQNRTTPTINKKDAQFVIDFIQEELDELKEAVENNDVVEIADAIGDIAYVGLGNAVNVFGLKDKMWAIYQEIQGSNLSKICKTEEEAIDTVKLRTEQYGEECYYKSVGSQYVVYRKSDDKVFKSKSYFSPNLNKFFTEEEISSCKK